MASNLISATILEMQFSLKGCCTQKDGATQINVFDSDLAIVTKLANHYQVNTAGQVPGAITFHKVFDRTKLYIYSFLFFLCSAWKVLQNGKLLYFRSAKRCFISTKGTVPLKKRHSLEIFHYCFWCLPGQKCSSPILGFVLEMES